MRGVVVFMQVLLCGLALISCARLGFRAPDPARDAAVRDVGVETDRGAAPPDARADARAPDQHAPDQKAADAGSAVVVHGWSRRFGDTAEDLGYGVAVGPGGNIFLTGRFQGTADFGGGDVASAGIYDVFVASYTPSGAYRWSKRFGGTTTDLGFGIAVDPGGNVYIVGEFDGATDLGGGSVTSAGSTDVFVASYTSAGAYRWSTCFGDTGSDHGRGVAVDLNGNVFVTGHYQGSVDFGGGKFTSAGGSQDAFVVSYTSSGVYRWSKSLGDTGTDIGRYLAVDGTGGLVTIGSFSGTVDFGGGGLVSAGGIDIYVASYTSSGAHRWSMRFGDTGADYGRAIAVDKGDNVVIAGRYSGTVDFGGGGLTGAGDVDIYVASYTPSGAHRWSRRFGGAGYDYAHAVAVDSIGNVFVTGQHAGTVDFGGGGLTSAGSSDIFVASYTSAGVYRWSRRHGDTASDYGRCVTVDSINNVFVTGQFSGAVDFGGGVLNSAGGTDIFLLQLSP